MTSGSTALTAASILKEEERAYTEREIERELRRRRIPLRQDLPDELLAGGGVPLGEGRWIHRENLPPIEGMGYAVEKELKAIVADSRRAWSVRELHSRCLRKRVFRSVPRWGMAAVLEASPFFQRTEDGLYLRRGAEGEREELRKTAEAVLAEEGSPLPLSLLLERLREHGLSGPLPPAWPVVRIAGNVFGLAERDLGVSRRDWETLCGAVEAVIAKKRRPLGADEIEGIQKTVCPKAPPLPGKVLIRALVSGGFRRRKEGTLGPRPRS